MGYSLTQKGYEIYDIHSKSFFIRRNVVFKDSIFPFLHVQSFGSHHFLVLDLPILDDVSSSQSQSPPSANPIQEEPSPESPPISSSPTPHHESSHSPVYPPLLAPRKSTRVKQSPAWMITFVTSRSFASHFLSYPMSSYVTYSHFSQSYQYAPSVYSSITEPTLFQQTSKDPSWINAMKLEMATLEDNHTWSIVDLPAGKTPIGCK